MTAAAQGVALNGFGRSLRTFLGGSRVFWLVLPAFVFFLVFFMLPVISLFLTSLDKPAAGVVAPQDREDISPLRDLETDAHLLAARVPALLVEAKRVSHTVTHGIHGRHRAGLDLDHDVTVDWRAIGQVWGRIGELLENRQVAPSNWCVNSDLPATAFSSVK